MYRLIRVAMSRPVLVALALGVFAENALAQQPTQAQTNAIRQSCRADYQTYCASVPAGGSAALGCLKENAATLSPACQRAVGAVGGPAAPAHGQGSPTAPTVSPGAPAPAAPAQTMGPRQEASLVRRACASDYRTYCSSVQPGGGRIIECLRENAPSLSGPCRSALASARQGR